MVAVSRGVLAVSLAACALSISGSQATAQDLQLRGGAALEGKAMHRDDGVLIRLPSGSINLLMKDVVTDVEALVDYDEREIVALAVAEETTPDERRQLLEIVLEFEPDDPAARRARGEIRIAGTWVPATLEDLELERFRPREGWPAPWAGHVSGPAAALVIARSEHYEVLCATSVIHADLVLERAELLLGRWQRRFGLLDWPPSGQRLRILVRGCGEGEPRDSTQAQRGRYLAPIAEVTLGDWDASQPLAMALALQMIERAGARGQETPPWLAEGLARWLALPAAPQARELLAQLAKGAQLSSGELARASLEDLRGSSPGSLEKGRARFLSLAAYGLVDFLLEAPAEAGGCRQELLRYLAGEGAEAPGALAAAASIENMREVLRRHLRARVGGFLERNASGDGIQAPPILPGSRIETPQQLEDRGFEALEFLVSHLSKESLVACGGSRDPARRMLARAAELFDARFADRARQGAALCALDPDPSVRGLAFAAVLQAEPGAAPPGGSSPDQVGPLPRELRDLIVLVLAGVALIAAVTVILGWRAQRRSRVQIRLQGLTRPPRR